MKLYAKTTSERATKGQGGNEYLNIEITAEGFEGIPTRANLYRVSISKSDKNGGLYAELLKYSDHEIIVLDNIKGKGQGDYCSRCKKLWQKHFPFNGQCPPEEKVKKKKGEKLTNICSNCGDNCHLLADMISEDGKEIHLCENCLRDTE